MEYRPLKITLVSAKDIKDMNTFSKQDVYAVVSLAGFPKSKQKTHVDKDCGTKPKWNHNMDFIVDEPFLTKPGHTILVEIFAESALRSDKLIGNVSLPLDDLFRSNSGDEKKTVEYQVITDGKPKGTLKFVYNFGEKFTHGGEAKKSGHDQPMAAYGAAKTGEPMTAYPAPPAPPGMGYPPAHYAQPPHYAPPPQAAYGGYPGQPSGYGYMPPPQPGYGYQPPQHGYGYPHGPPAGYAAYPAGHKPQKPKKGGMGMGAGLGLGLGAGLLGGLLVGEAIDDIGDAASYADGYGDAMGDGFDF